MENKSITSSSGNKMLMQAKERKNVYSGFSFEEFTNIDLAETALFLNWAGGAGGRHAGRGRKALEPLQGRSLSKSHEDWKKQEAMCTQRYGRKNITLIRRRR